MGWKSHLNDDPVEWLLGRDNPSVRYFTLVDILGKSSRNREVVQARRDIMKTGVVPKILAKQRKGGYWEDATRFYTAKYKGTVWQLLILAEHGADGKDGRIKKASEFILDKSQDRESGGFYPNMSKKPAAGEPAFVLPCLTGNMIFSLLRFGYLKDTRVQHGIDWMTKYQRFDDGIKKAPKGWPYDRYKGCWGKHTCHMGVVKALKALAEIPPGKRNKKVKSTIEAGAEYMLRHHVHKRSHNLNRVAKSRWSKLGFPLMWDISVLEMLMVLTKLGYRDDRMQEAVALVESKQDRRGRWNLESTFNGRFQTNIERLRKPSKWVTLGALRVLQKYYR